MSLNVKIVLIFLNTYVLRATTRIRWVVRCADAKIPIYYCLHFHLWVPATFREGKTVHLPHVQRRVVFHEPDKGSRALRLITVGFYSPPLGVSHAFKDTPLLVAGQFISWEEYFDDFTGFRKKSDCFIGQDPGSICYFVRLCRIFVPAPGKIII